MNQFLRSILFCGVLAWASVSGAAGEYIDSIGILEAPSSFKIALIKNRTRRDGFKPGSPIVSEGGLQADVEVKDFGGTEKFEKYIEGVVLAEVGNLRFDRKALEVMAIAARTYSQRIFRSAEQNNNAYIGPAGAGVEYLGKLKVMPLFDVNLRRVIERTDKVLVTNTTRFHEYIDPDTSDFSPSDREFRDLVREAVRVTKGRVITYDGQLIRAEYFDGVMYKDGNVDSKYRGFTKNNEESNSQEGVYENLQRMNVSPERRPVGTLGHGRGLSQHGANVLAEDGLAFGAILKHYYGPNPPFIRAFEIEQGGQLMYRYEWRDEPSYDEGSSLLVRNKVVTASRAVDLARDAIFRWYLSERTIEDYSDSGLVFEANGLEIPVAAEAKVLCPPIANMGNCSVELQTMRVSAGQWSALGIESGLNVFGSYDVSDLVESFGLDPNPGTFAHKNLIDNSWDGYESTPDVEPGVRGGVDDEAEFKATDFSSAVPFMSRLYIEDYRTEKVPSGVRPDKGFRDVVFSIGWDETLDEAGVPASREVIITNDGRIPPTTEKGSSKLVVEFSRAVSAVEVEIAGCDSCPRFFSDAVRVAQNPGSRQLIPLVRSDVGADTVFSCSGITFPTLSNVAASIKVSAIDKAQPSVRLDMDPRTVAVEPDDQNHESTGSFVAPIILDTPLIKKTYSALASDLESEASWVYAQDTDVSEYVQSRNGVAFPGDHEVTIGFEYPVKEARGQIIAVNNSAILKELEFIDKDGRGLEWVANFHLSPEEIDETTEYEVATRALDFGDRQTWGCQEICVSSHSQNRSS